MHWPVANEGEDLVSPFPVVFSQYSIPYYDEQEMGDYHDSGLLAGPDVWYQVQVPQGGYLRAGTCAWSQLSGSNQIDSYLWLLAADGETVLADDDNGCPGSDRFSYLTSGALEAGTYYLVVESADGEDGTYQLSIEVQPGDCPPLEMRALDYAAWEPNNESAFAAALPLGNALGGRLSQGMDWIRLDGMEPGTLYVDLQADSFNPWLEVYASTPSGLEQVQYVDAAGYCTGELLSWTWDSPAYGPPFYLVIHASEGDPAQAYYVVNAACSTEASLPGDFRQQPLAVDALPFSDSRDTGSYQDTGYQPSADVWYGFHLDEVAPVLASTCSEGTAFDTWIRILEVQSGIVVAQSDDSPACDAAATASSLWTELDPGDYLLLVEGSGQAEGVYDLVLGIQPCDAPDVQLSYDEETHMLRLEWETLPYATRYRVWRGETVYGAGRISLRGEPTSPAYEEALDPGSANRQFYHVTAVCGD